MNKESSRNMALYIYKDFLFLLKTKKLDLTYFGDMLYYSDIV